MSAIGQIAPHVTDSDRAENIVARFSEMKAKRVNFIDEPRRITRKPDHLLWMAFFKDPDGSRAALMEERR